MGFNLLYRFHNSKKSKRHFEEFNQSNFVGDNFAHFVWKQNPEKSMKNIHSETSCYIIPCLCVCVFDILVKWVHHENSHHSPTKTIMQTSIYVPCRLGSYLGKPWKIEDNFWTWFDRWMCRSEFSLQNRQSHQFLTKWVSSIGSIANTEQQSLCCSKHQEKTISKPIALRAKFNTKPPNQFGCKRVDMCIIDHVFLSLQNVGISLSECPHTTPGPFKLQTFGCS